MNTPNHFGKTLLLRGFGEFVSWKHIKNSATNCEKYIVKDLINYIVSNEFNTIAWDGDLYKSDSFTHVIYELMKEHPQLQYVAFKSNSKKFFNGDSKNGEVGWNQLHFQFKPSIYLHNITSVNPNLPWFDKHTQTLHEIYDTVSNKSTSFSVLYLGGGKIVEAEMKNILTYIPNSKEFTISFLDVPRASFSIDKQTGQPKSVVQYLGNSTTSIDPLSILPSSFQLKNHWNRICLSFSKTKYLSIYSL